MPNSSKRPARTFSLDRLPPSALITMSADLQALAQKASCRQDAADRMVEYLYTTLRVDNTGDPACALVRCFQTHPFDQLPAALHIFAKRQLGSTRSQGSVRCLSLLATRGIDPAWNSVADSAGHQAIPLPTVDVILRAPMIARLILEMGIRFEHVVSPPEGGKDFLMEAPSEGFNVFHVEKALGSPYIPAQATFIHPFRVRSVVGLGGLLPGGELFAIILFTRVPVSRATAELFRPLASVLRGELSRFPSSQTFFEPANTPSASL